MIISNRKEKMAGFLKGFELVYESRARQQTLETPHAILARQASQEAYPFVESANTVSIEAYTSACHFALHMIDFLLREHPQRFTEWNAWFPAQRASYAHEMAEELLPYL